MIFSMTGLEKGDLLRQVTTWAGLTVHVNMYYSFRTHSKLSQIMEAGRRTGE
jgi:hypothetical protein